MTYALSLVVVSSMMSAITSDIFPGITSSALLLSYNVLLYIKLPNNFLKTDNLLKYLFNTEGMLIDTVYDVIGDVFHTLLTMYQSKNYLEDDTRLSLLIILIDQ